MKDEECASQDGVHRHGDNDDIESSKEHSSSEGNSGSSHRSSCNSAESGANGDVQSFDECSVTKTRTKHVNRSKGLVYGTLLAAAIVVGSLTYVFTRKQEQHSFHVAFTQYAEATYANVEAATANLFGQVRLLGVTLTSHSLANGAFPEVTIARFDRRSQDARSLSGAELIFLAPIVKESQLDSWERYAYEQQSWVYDDWRFHRGERDYAQNPGNITPQVYSYETLLANLENDPTWTGTTSEGSNKLGPTSPAIDEPFHVPIWETGPVPNNASLVNFDVYTHPAFKSIIDNALQVKHMLLSGLSELQTIIHYTSHGSTDDDSPSSLLVDPIFEDFYPESKIVAFLFAKIQWHKCFLDILPPDVKGILVDLRGSCGDSFSFMLNGRTPTYLGSGRYYNDKYVDTKYVYQFAQEAQYDEMALDGHCEYTMTIYPTFEFEQTFYSNNPAVYCALVVMVFMFTTMIFAIYNYMIFRRQEKLLFTAQRTKAIVTSLFPKEIHDRIMANAAEAEAQRDENSSRTFTFAPKAQIQQFLVEGDKRNLCGDKIFKTKPIADLFPEVTVMFADLVGFTAWSSTREPAEVFTLLESIYFEFDQIAMRRRVFKVETIGDCYVAVCGLPQPQSTHFTIMCRFARDCLHKMNVLVRQLETTLGPDTADLGLRIGLHSGPVTAGVLRGERARFQLFGDTVNVTARIETTSAKNRIQVSTETAELLQQAGKGHWTRLRDDVVHASGKGQLRTYWLDIKGEKARSQSSGGGSSDATDIKIDDDDGCDEKEMLSVIDITRLTGEVKNNVKEKAHPISETNMRLVSWNVDLLARAIREQVARREALGLQAESPSSMRELELKTLGGSSIPLDEVTDTIKLPAFNAGAAEQQHRASGIDLGDEVLSQLADYVQTIAALYRNNPFHSFAHASHVTMSVVKLLSRIVTPEIDVTGKSDEECNKALFDTSFGITASPLTKFAIILSALILDIDHTGLPNSELIINEQTAVAEYYKYKSVAEQNSFEIAWDLLMQDSFADLRRAIYATPDEFCRFRQILVNAVMATDIMDESLNIDRQARWVVAFDEATASGISEQERNDRKATIVIEHLIQASDVAHTMQHWHIYRKWNARLFEEMYKAFKDGRSQTDPSENWYTGEIQCFDSYVIPLAKKLKDCGVFGVSSDEYLNYALLNRREWEAKGQEIVAAMIDSLKTKEWK